MPGYRVRNLAPVLLALSATAITIVSGCASSGPVEARIPILQQQAIPYVCAKDDEAGRDAMERVAGRFNVHLRILDAAQARPLSGATVVVASAEGQLLLHVVAIGSLLYMTLEPGMYRLTVGYQGRTDARDIVVGAAPMDLTFRLPVNVLEDNWLLCGTADSDAADR